MGKSKIAFIDRDGTINVEKDYISNPDQIELIEGSGEAIKLLNQSGYRVFGISNQSGIARGFFSIDDLHAINRRVIELVGEQGGLLEEIFYCPHHPEGSIKELSVKCDCRKPGSGMIRAAEEKYRLKPDEIVVIGDKLCDIETGQGIGATSILVNTGYGKEHSEIIKKNGLTPPDHYAANLKEAAAIITAKKNASESSRE